MDISIFYFFYNFTGYFSGLNWFFIFGARYLFYLLILVFIMFLFLDKRLTVKQKRVWIILAFAAAGFARGILTETIRYFYHSPRPLTFDGNISPLISESSYSFPSGHTIFLFAFVTIVFFYNKKLAYWLSAGSLLTGITRIIVGVHWPSDILGGIVLGILVSFLFYKIARKKNLLAALD